MPIWMTETGAGAPRTATARTGGRPAEIRGCRAVHRILKSWYRDPRITAAVQYTLREDDVFPTGLVTTDLTPRLSGAEGVAAVGPAGARAPRGSAARQAALRLSPSRRPVRTR